MKIMLVDDSRTIRNLQKNILSQMGYTDVAEVADGKQAIDTVHDVNPDLILLGWNMPNMNGLEFLEAFRKDNKTTPVIMVTGEAEKSRVIQAIKAGVNNYVVKPFTPDVLSARINETLQKRAAG